ncbi:hypothetical protein BC629DRAFT_410495 [Irpex lacteus]|nr:hypothetical protein BC629DRAFT_410495 [Irpex lacteus]
MSQSSRSYAPSISDISYRREPRESGATAPTPTSSSLTPPSSLKRARRHPMQFPAGTTVETITMTTKEYSHRMDERIVYHDNVGVPIEDMILQALDPRSHLHARCGLSQRISDEHFCEKGYVCSYTLFDGSCEYPNIHSYPFAITYKHWKTTATQRSQAHDRRAVERFQNCSCRHHIHRPSWNDTCGDSTRFRTHEEGYPSL